MLEAASVVGEAFEVAVVAASTECPVEEVEARCEALAAQHHVIEDTGLTAGPDGTRGGGYRFQHVLYQQVLYEQVGTGRVRSSTGALGHGWRRAMAPAPGKSRPSWPSTSSAGARSRGPCTIGSRRGTMPPGVMPITKPSPPSPKG